MVTQVLVIFVSLTFVLLLVAFVLCFPRLKKNKTKKTHCYVSNDTKLLETAIPLAKATRNFKLCLAAC